MCSGWRLAEQPKGHALHRVRRDGTIGKAASVESAAGLCCSEGRALRASCRYRGDLPTARCMAAIVACLSLWPSGHAAAQVGFGVVGGVYIDADGMLRETARLSSAERLEMLRSADATARIPDTIAAASNLRRVSLRRLEEEVRRLHAEGLPLPADVRCLAGLQQVKYVLFYPEDADVVLAGPAEGWRRLDAGDLVGVDTGQPVLQLDDLLVALRYAFALDRADGFLGCSIEPTAEGIKRHDRLRTGLSGVDPSNIDSILRQMEQAMGPQEVLVYGAPASSRFALQMVAADYHLKRLALGHDPSPSKQVESYLDIVAKTTTGAPQPQHRWWFVGHYDAVEHTADRLAYEFVGAGLKVATAPAHGPGKQPRESKAATLFAEAATRAVPELVAHVPAFAELQNLVSLAVTAEIVRQRGETADAEGAEAEGQGSRPPQPPLAKGGSENAVAQGARRSSWRPTHFLDDGACPIGVYATPRRAPALANVRFVQNRHWLFSISGGVEIVPEELAAETNQRPTRDAKLDTARKALAIEGEHASWWSD